MVIIVVIKIVIKVVIFSNTSIYDIYSLDKITEHNVIGITSE